MTHKTGTCDLYVIIPKIDIDYIWNVLSIAVAPKDK